ncbi:Metallo-dependent phosphatase [Russula dissimulans]|nr:Metallo-dependent phosphatase [Russula dissimulans]
MTRVRGLLACAVLVTLRAARTSGLAASSSPLPPPSSYAPPGAFPTSLFESYYNDPTATTAQPQPVVSDPVLHKIFPPELTDPNDIPQNDTQDPHPLPEPASGESLLQNALSQFDWILTDATLEQDKCATCISVLNVAQFLSLAAPEQGPAFFVFLCQELELLFVCEKEFSATTYGSVLTQIFAKANVRGYDGQMCPRPALPPLNLTGWFSKPKPDPLPSPRKPSGKLLKVLHLSDFHIDPRYATGSEANCTSSPCCRSNSVNAQSPNHTALPAPRFGSFDCDTPLSLAAAVLEATPELTGTVDTGFDFSIYTGDVVSHDPENQLSRDYVMLTEDVAYGLLKRISGGPLYPVLGNHDTYNQAQDAPHSLGGDQYSWNYEHVAGLWNSLPQNATQEVRSHYGAYSVRRPDGLRVIAINTDFHYMFDFWNYVEANQPDVSGMWRFVTDECQDAEDKGDRVWIIGHVPTGWDGTDALEVPTNLFYQIVDRYSPHVIANIFFGHTHEDQFQIFYSNNGTIQSDKTAVTTGWIGPSVTTYTGLNPGLRMYQVDSVTFEVVNAYTWTSDVSSYPGLDGQTAVGPTFGFEYSTREAYGKNIDWPEDGPLNATWWHRVTENMETDPDLVETFTKFQGKGSVLTAPCTDPTCIKAKICYMRSGSATLAIQNCGSSFGSVG